MAWGITREGHRVLLHLTLGNKESYENWRDLWRDMVGQGSLDNHLGRSPGVDSNHRGDVAQEFEAEVFGS